MNGHNWTLITPKEVRNRKIIVRKVKSLLKYYNTTCMFNPEYNNIIFKSGEKHIANKLLPIVTKFIDELKS